MAFLLVGMRSRLVGSPCALEWFLPPMNCANDPFPMAFPQLPDSPERRVGLPIERRQFLGAMGLTGLGVLATSNLGEAAPSNSMPIVKLPTSSGSAASYSLTSAPTLDLPEEWADRNRSVHAYYRYLQSLRLKRVDAKQVIESHVKSRGLIWNGLPPREWWNRMGYMLKVAERLALEMNVSEVEVISAYRSPAYNATCRGKSGSWHKANVAVDVKFPVRASKVTAKARELRDLGLFRGGVGGYWDFTHIDARGTNVNW